MCLILFAVEPSPEVALVVAANRDEDHARPTQPAHAWLPPSTIFGGRDERSGGTWLAVAPGGRLAAVTNVRAPGARREGRSRGALPVRFADTKMTADVFVRGLEADLPSFPAFNLLLADPNEGVFFWSDEGGPARRIEPGIHGLSNARLDVPWPKVVRGRQALSNALSLRREAMVDRLFEVLADEARADDTELPSTGVPIEIERLLAPAFIRGPMYGTRCSTVVVVERSGRVHFQERSFGAEGVLTGTVATTV